MQILNMLQVNPVCMLDNQTLADLSAIFTDNVRSSIATKETTDKQAVANDLIDTKTETKTL